MPQTALPRIALLLLALLGSVLSAAAQVERLPGRYVGISDAEGMKLDLSREAGRLRGRFVDANGQAAEIDAAILGSAAEAVLSFPDRKLKVRIFPEAIGLRMITIPLDANEQPLVEEIQALIFVPPGTKLPEIPAGYQDPVMKVRVVDPDTFLISYEFWPPEGVAYGYESLEARYRPLIGLFPVVLTDILWKLCSSSYQPAVLGEALRGQGVTCNDVLAKLDEIQRRGRFDRYKAEVHREKKVLLDAARCARGYTALPAICEPAAKRVSEAATSLVTVASVLRRF